MIIIRMRVLHLAVFDQEQHWDHDDRVQPQLRVCRGQLLHPGPHGSRQGEPHACQVCHQFLSSFLHFVLDVNLIIQVCQRDHHHLQSP